MNRAVISNRGKTTKDFFQEEALSGILRPTRCYGADFTETVRDVFDIDLEALDRCYTDRDEEEDGQSAHIDIIQSVDSIKEDLCKMARRDEIPLLAALFSSNQIPFIRYDRGHTLEEASKEAALGNEENMYFSAYPSAIYKLVKTYYPEYILGNEHGEVAYEKQDIEEAILRMPPSSLVRTLESYQQRGQEQQRLILDRVDRVEEYFYDMDYSLFQGILSQEEFVELKGTVEETIGRMDLTLFDPLLHRTVDLAGYSNASPKRLEAGVAVNVNASEEQVLRTIIHEYIHTAFARIVGLRDEESPENTKILGVRYNSGIKGAAYEWLNESLTELLTSYIYDHMRGEEASLDSEFLRGMTFQENNRFMTDAYQYEIDLLHVLVEEGVISLQDSIRLYLGFPPVDAELNLARYYKNLSSLLGKLFGIPSYVLNEITEILPVRDIPKLMLVLRKILEQDVGNIVEEGKFNLDYLKRKKYDPDTIALDFISPGLRDLYQNLGVSIYVDDQALEPSDIFLGKTSFAQEAQKTLN